MNFFRYGNIEEDLANKKLQDKQILPYFIMYLTLSIAPIASANPQIPNKYDYIINLVNILFATFGTLYLYKKNGGVKGYDFVIKYVVLSWILLIRSLFCVMLPSFILYKCIMHFYFPDIHHTTLFSVIAIVIFYITILYRLGKHFELTINHELLHPQSTLESK